MRKNIVVLLLLLAAASASAQVFPGVLSREVKAPRQIPGPNRLSEFVVDGKLRLGLEDAIALTLLNNTDIQVDRAQYDISQFAILHAHATFDPQWVSSFSPLRSTSPTTTSLSGASTLSVLNQTSMTGYTQEFLTGTTVGANFSTTRTTTNSSFTTVNPSFTSGLTFSLSQPLWRDRGVFPNRAPIVIAQLGAHQSRATLEGQISDIIQRVIVQYWDVVQARETLAVTRKFLELAQASYARDKRTLELGALPPLDIYRSESQVAQKKLAVIQAEYSLKQAEILLRQALGADLDDRVAALDLELTEKAEAGGSLSLIDLREALVQALKNRPEIEAQNQQLAMDDLRVKLANNTLKPRLDLTASYTSSGLGGVVFASGSSGNPVVISTGGFATSLNQVGSFSFPTYGLTLQLALPVRSSAARADLSTAQVAKRSALYQMRGLEQSISTEVKNAVHDLEQAEFVITAAETSRDLLAKTLSAEERKYQLGAQQLFFVLQAQNDLSQGELGLLQAKIAYQKAVAEVDHATGALLRKHNVSIASMP